MRQAELVTLNMRELDRLKMVQAIVEMGLKPGRAAERLQPCERQVGRLVRSGVAWATANECSKHAPQLAPKMKSRLFF
ncbi:hypothetical protein [Paraburkholderia sp. BCC1885]|uniref:hypothetical protein n=1 Tax=Paraburkholderia sp. BCC1885 TaxID=2562669 RepID=UPI001182F2FC|nr:hypothetical protein [Paraburkholderia sp. BCC1885]